MIQYTPTSSGWKSAANVVSGDIWIANARRSISKSRDAWEVFFAFCFHTLFTTRTKKLKIYEQNYC